MNKMTITLSDEAAAWIRDKVDDGFYADEGAYIETLVRWQIEALIAAIEEGEKSGVCPQSIDEICAEIEEAYAKRTKREDA